MEKIEHLNRVPAYRYRTYNEREIQTITNKKIWMTNPKWFNDPYDCSITLSMDKMIEKFMVQRMIRDYSDKMPEKHCIELAKQLWQSFREGLETKENLNEIGMYLKKYIRNIGVACFSLDNNNPYMWSIYSNVYKGFCIEYGIGDLMIIGGFGRVAYEDTTAKLYTLLMEKAEAQDLIEQFVLTKHKCWAHEDEWRLVGLFDEINDNTPGVLIDSPPIKGIYLGCKIDARAEVKLCGIANELNVPIFKTRMKPDNFEIEIMPNGVV
jgi:hypothetical protein